MQVLLHILVLNHYETLLSCVNLIILFLGLSLKRRLIRKQNKRTYGQLIRIIIFKTQISQLRPITAATADSHTLAQHPSLYPDTPGPSVHECEGQGRTRSIPPPLSIPRAPRSGVSERRLCRAEDCYTKFSINNFKCCRNLLLLRV